MYTYTKILGSQLLPNVHCEKIEQHASFYDNLTNRSFDLSFLQIEKGSIVLKSGMLDFD